MSSPVSFFDSFSYQILESSSSVTAAELDPEMNRYPLNSIKKHDVFLSFRGEDTRASFISHLHASLQNSGINVFKDDHSLQRGDNISISLLQAIEDSRISIIVFSINYASSQWCLQELTQIIECHRTIGQAVLPVFYNVDPSDVRRQSCEFGKAFQNLFNTVSVEEDHVAPSWRHALHYAAGLAGFVVLNPRLLFNLIATFCNDSAYTRTHTSHNNVFTQMSSLLFRHT